MTQVRSNRAEVTGMNLAATLTRRRWPARASGSPSTIASSRAGTQPPSLRQAPASRSQRLWFWLLAPAPRDAAHGPLQLGHVRADFHAAARDLTLVPDANDLVHAIDNAHTLRELWHLRADVYRVVALQYSQSEAEARLAQLNRHFPTRSPRSGFAPL